MPLTRQTPTATAAAAGPPSPFLRHLEDWCECLRGAYGYQPNTITRYRGLVDRMRTELALEDPSALNFGLLEGHLKLLFVLGAAPATRALAAAAIKSFCAYLVTHRIIGHNPALQLRRPRSYSRERAYLRPEEVGRLFFLGGSGWVPSEPLAARNTTMLMVGYICGLRRSEYGPLRLEDLLSHGDRETRYSILVRRGKWADADERLVLDRSTSTFLSGYLSIRAAAWPTSVLLFPNLKGGQLSAHQVARLFARRIRKAKIEPRGRSLTPHILRHSLATHLLAAGWSLEEVRLRMRHKDGKTTLIYVHADPGREAIRLERKHPLRASRARAVVNLPVAVSALIDDIRGMGSVGQMANRLVV